MITCRKDVLDLLDNLDYIRIVPSYFEKVEDYSSNLCYLEYMKIDDNVKKDMFKNFIVLDTETTGFSPKHGGKIVQVTAIKFVDFKPTQIFTTYINPNRLIPYSVTQIHGITNEMVEYSPVFGEIIDALGEFVKGSILIGHNISFDLNFLMSEGLDLLNMDVTIVDTLQLSRRFIKKDFIENYKLVS